MSPLSGNAAIMFTQVGAILSSYEAVKSQLTSCISAAHAAGETYYEGQLVAAKASVEAELEVLTVMFGTLQSANAS